MLSLVPKLHELVGSAASRNLMQMRELGVEPTDRSAAIAVVVAPSSPSRRLMAASLIDMLLRLDPLVGEVIIDAPGMDEAALASELAIRLPLAVGTADRAADFSIGVGSASSSTDLAADGAGWLASLGVPADADDDGNPVGPLAGAALTAGEAFKWAFSTIYPERAALLEMPPWNGVFSFFSYDMDTQSPGISDVRIATTLVGVGGVGAGFIRTIAALGRAISGSLDLVDQDVLTIDNLNRVSFATLASALAGTAKVVEAEALLRSCCPGLAVNGFQATFDQYKRRIPRRADRTYDVVVTGLDDDQARWEVQRDMPRVLIDGATGRDMVARVERVEFGRYGCLGCSRRPVPLPAGGRVDCDAPPDSHAPSLSFLSSFPGILAAGEVIKEAMGTGSLRGSFDHVFRYGPNPDLVGMPATRPDCKVGCGRPAKLRQYQEKYPDEHLAD